MTLDEFIRDRTDVRELKRAIAVKMSLTNLAHSLISTLLQVSEPFVSKWVAYYHAEGVASLHLHYEGAPSYLSPAARQAVIAYLQTQPSWRLEEVVHYLETRYQVIYQSPQSNYDLLTEAGLSWKRTQPVNPKKNEAQVVAKRAELKDVLSALFPAVQQGTVSVLMEDECHLRWGDVCGYVWGQRDQRIEVPLTNARQWQTYYGALDVFTGEFLVQPYPAGKGIYTVEYLKWLQSRRPDQRLVLIWDGASYHQSAETRAYLAELNAGLPEADWKITCLLFAPHAPEQNPVEDAWLRAKTFLRKHFAECLTFAAVKQLFLEFLQQQVFEFPKLAWYR